MTTKYLLFFICCDRVMAHLRMHALAQEISKLLYLNFIHIHIVNWTVSPFPFFLMTVQYNMNENS